MPSILSDIKFVDLKRSSWDEKKSDRKKGHYEFKNKVYYRNKDFSEGYIHPYKLKWCRYEPSEHYRSVRTWEVKYKSSFLTTQDDYWPEGLTPDTEGKYVFMDLVAVKIPIEVHMAKRKADVERADRQARAVRDRWKAQTEQGGVGGVDDVVEKQVERMHKEMEEENIDIGF